MIDYYEILEIERTEDEKIIKNAYFSLLRKFPPEKDPEGFKKIREAYDRLIDPVSRSVYNAYSLHEDEIEILETSGNSALENNDYKTAIREFKKILLIEPKLLFAKNELALAFLYDGQYDEAIKHFNELLVHDSGNPIYYYNTGFAYNKKSDFIKGKYMWEKGYEIDPINESIIMDLTDLYLYLKEFDNAENILRKCIQLKTENPNQKIVYYFELLKLYVITADNRKFETVAKEIQEFSPNNNEMNSKLAIEFIRMSKELKKMNMNYLTAILNEIAVKLDKNVNNEYNDTENTDQSYYRLQMLRMLNDTRIVEIVKKPFDIMSNMSSSPDREVKFQISLDELNSYIDKNPEIIIKSIKIFKKKYNELYLLTDDFYDNMLENVEGIMISSNQTTMSARPENTSSADNNGCLVIAVCAIIGGIIFPGIGFFIGAYIGYKLSQ